MLFSVLFVIFIFFFFFTFDAFLFLWGCWLAWQRGSVWNWTHKHFGGGGRTVCNTVKTKVTKAVLQVYSFFIQHERSTFENVIIWLLTFLHHFCWLHCYFTEAIALNVRCTFCLVAGSQLKLHHHLPHLPYLGNYLYFPPFLANNTKTGFSASHMWRWLPAFSDRPASGWCNALNDISICSIYTKWNINWSELVILF